MDQKQQGYKDQIENQIELKGVLTFEQLMPLVSKITKKKQK